MTQRKKSKTVKPPARASAAKARRKSRPKLRNLSEIRRFFIRNETPVYFVSATNFNLLGMDEWVRNFWFINHIDCFDGAHPHTFVPEELPHDQFESIEDINNYLLSHKQVVDFVRSRGTDGRNGKVLFLMFDERTEELASKLGLEVSFPPAALRQRIDDKIETTRIADEAGVPSVPNVLCKVESYADLRKKARRLGEELVIQTAYGDSGHTTFFVSDEAGYREHAEEIQGADEVKVMKRLRCRGSAQEACVTRHGTIVGPLMTELVGFEELTPYKGGWCGNEVVPDHFPTSVRRRARDMTFKLGEALRDRGYRGYFEVDYLTDLDTGKLYLGEINPRVTGASSMTNLSAFAHADAPLILFHLLEFMDVDYELDVADINERWSQPESLDPWSQMVIKATGKEVDVISAAPRTGVYHLHPDGRADFVRVQSHRRTVQREDRGFFLRISRPGDWCYEGADLGILVTPGRLMTPAGDLTPRAKSWIHGIRTHFHAGGARPRRPEPVEVGGFKFL